MVSVRVPRRIAEFPKTRQVDKGFAVDLTFDSRLLLTYVTDTERCLDELIEGSWHPVLRTDPSKHFWAFAQPLGDERFLLVNARTSGPSEPNASVIDSSGREAYCCYLGDGVEHCQVDEIGNIWVGYFDEGVFGDQDLGHQGLIKFDQAGQPKFQFGRDAGDLPGVDDCYALNVTGRDEAWLSYYSSFVLVQVRADKAELILDKVPVEGSSAITLDRNRRYCAFWSGYKKDSRVRIVDLMTKTHNTLSLRTESGDKFPNWASAARGSRLILNTASALYEFDLDTDL